MHVRAYNCRRERRRGGQGGVCQEADQVHDEQLQRGGRAHEKMPRIARAPATNGRQEGRSRAKYPPELCKAICRGLMQEKKGRVMGIRSLCIVGEKQEKWKGELLDVNKHHDVEEIKEYERLRGGDVNVAALGEAWDDLTGLPLDAEEALKATKLEMKYAADKKVWTKMMEERDAHHQDPMDRHQQR